MGNKFVWLVVAAVLLGLGAQFLTQGSVTRESPLAGAPLVAAKETRGDSGPDLAQDVPVAPAAEGEKSQRRAEVVAAPSQAEAEALADEKDTRAHVIGQLLLPSGKPAVGAKLKLHGYVSDSEREQKYGAPDSWEDVTAVSGVDGRFDLAVEPSLAFQFTMDASLEGHAGLSWRWRELPPGSTTDVKVQTLAIACRVTGKVVDKEGAATGEQWFIYADASVGATGDGREQTTVRTPADRVTGAFELTGLPPGPLELKAYSPKANWVTRRKIEASPDDVVNVEIVYDGPDLSSTISIRTSCHPFHIFSRREGLRVVARAADGTEFESKSSGRSSGSLDIPDVPPGRYTVEATSPLHETWTKDGVEPGDRVEVRLKGAARLALTVVEDVTGNPVESYRLRVRFNGSRSFPNVYAVLGRGEEPPPGGLFEKLIPWDVTLLVDAEGFAPLALSLGELEANVTRSAEARLFKGGGVEVTVSDGASKPAVGAKVLLHPYFAGYDPRDSSSGPAGMSERQALKAETLELTAGAGGRASFESVAPGEYGLLATAGPLSAKASRIEVIDGARVSETLTFPRSGSLEGRLVGGPPGSFVGVRVRARQLEATGPAHRRTTRGEEPGTAAVGEDGTFRIGPLFVGSHEVELYLPERMVATSTRTSTSTESRRLRLGEVEVIAGEPTEVTFDAAEMVPASMEVTVRRNDKVGAGLLVRLGEEEGREWDGATLGAEGTTRFARVLPGEWQVTVRAMTERWTYSHGEALKVLPGADVALEISFETARGRLRVFDAATSKPLASRQVYHNGDRGLLTDADGWLDLELPLGPFTLQGAPRDVGPAVTPVAIDWRATGPSVEEVTLMMGDER